MEKFDAHSSFQLFPGTRKGQHSLLVQAELIPLVCGLCLGRRGHTTVLTPGLNVSDGVTVYRRQTLG